MRTRGDVRLRAANAATAALTGFLALALVATTARGGGAGPLAQERAAAGAAPAAVALGTSFQTAMMDPTVFSGPDADLAFARSHDAGARAVRLVLYWSAVAPDSARPTRPPNFDAADPAHPGYRWEAFDRQVIVAARRGLTPIVNILHAPRWAEGAAEGEPGTREPNATELALFAKAAARRYGGGFGGAPRVRYWQVWNEPNLELFLNPQSPALYRRLVNSFAAAVKSVHPDNVVVAGGTSPFGFPGVAVPPLRFMRQLLCISPRLRPTCRTRIRFDVWTHHPYTSGGPRHRAARTDDVSLGNLPAMRRVLDAAKRAGIINSRGPVRFWVTEFSWDSKPPDPKAVPTELHTRWVAEALYRMWQVGVSLVTWYSLRDEPLTVSQFQSGLYYQDPTARLQLVRPKPALQAFRFPFVAFRTRTGVVVWGRTAGVRRQSVVVEQQRGNGWRRVGTFRSGVSGVFTGKLRTAARTPLRARAGGEASVPFSLGRTGNLEVWPFGCGGVLSCD